MTYAEMEADGEDVVFSYPDWQANTFAVDCNGRRAVLAVSQKWLAVVSLSRPVGDENEGPPKALRKLARQNKYEIKTVLWNPHPAKVDLLASTNQQKLEVWNVNAERYPLLHSIKAHTRPISDLSWSFTDPHLLASCAVDSFVHIWDIRETRRPKASFRAVAGASLVQWNRLNGNILASAHDSDIRVWDMRKTTTASGYISAHMSRIHDLDWSYHSAKQLTTCSHDASIKFWDISHTREPLSSIKAGSQPLWRARNYPVGHAVANVVVPAMHGGDSRVFLWSRSNVSAPLHTFAGHSEPVLEVQWKKYNGDYQLVTWSKDHTLRVWSIAEDLKESVGVDPGDQSLVDDASLSLTLAEVSLSSEAETEQSITSLTRSEELSLSHVSELSSTPTGTSPTKSFTPSLVRSVHKETPGSPQVFQSMVAHTLSQEFSLLNHVNIPNLFMERMESSQRSCTVRVEQGSHLVRIGITFPHHYPNGAAPYFTFDKSSTIDISTQQQLHSIITETALSCVKQNRPCLEQCLKRLAKSLESFVSRPQPPNQQSPGFEIPFGHLDDEHIPFPRTSGGRFCANGFLVCFHLPPGLVLPTDVKQTPRTMDKLNFYRSHICPVPRGAARWSGGYLSSSIPKRGSAPNLLQVPGGGGWEKAGGIRDKGGRGGLDTVNPYTGKLTIHNITPMLPIDYNLATAYSLTGSNLEQLCAENATVAAVHGRADLVQAWSTAALIADERIRMTPDPDSGMPWPQHPFGRGLIRSLFSHFENLHDVQTLAMLACVFQMHSSHATEGRSKAPRKSSLGTTSNNNNHSKKTAGGSPPVLSSSWHDVVVGDFPAGPEDEQNSHEMNCRLLDDLLTCKCDEYRRSYANILYRWEMLTQRAEVLKFQVARKESQMKIGFSSQCRRCSELVTGPSCKNCKCFAFTCSICNLSVRGSSNFCRSCGHGGHARHMLEWFEKCAMCPAGCGCKCLETSWWT